jgi:YVTN family beta-propeller protein
MGPHALSIPISGYLPMLRRVSAALLMVASANGIAHAGQGFANVKQNIFVAARASQTLTVIDTESEQVIGAVELGLEPKQLAVSDSVAKLAAIDGEGHRIVLLELVSSNTRSIDFDFVPTKLVLAPDGLQLAVIGDGKMAFLDLLFVKETARATGLPPVQDAVFSGDSRQLIASVVDSNGLVIVDTGTGRETGRIGWKADVSAIVRSVNGREGFAKAASGSEVAHLDLINGRVIGQIQASPRAEIVSTGLGKWLLAADAVEGKLRVARSSPLTAAATLDADPGVSALYSAWFDTVAIASGFRKAVIYDLDTMRKVRDIPLEGAAGPGSVTPDGKRLFLPLEDAGKVAVIDAQLRRLTNMISVGPKPIAAVMAGSYGICH